jgi:hypothetical protein
MLSDELIRRAEEHEAEAERSHRYYIANSYDSLADTSESANMAAAKAYREAAELVRRP